MAICLNIDTTGESSSKVSIVMSVVRSVFMLCLCLMYFKVVKYVNDRSRNGKVPARFGRYQRNVLTLKQCLSQGLLHSIIGLRVPIMSFMSYDVSSTRTFIFWTNIIFFLTCCCRAQGKGKIWKNLPWSMTSKLVSHHPPTTHQKTFFDTNGF